MAATLGYYGQFGLLLVIKANLHYYGHFGLLRPLWVITATLRYGLWLLCANINSDGR